MTCDIRAKRQNVKTENLKEEKNDLKSDLNSGSTF